MYYFKCWFLVIYCLEFIETLNLTSANWSYSNRRPARNIHAR